MANVVATDLYRIKTLSRPQAAASRVFFNENYIDRESGEYRSAIYAFDEKTGGKQNFGTNGEHDGQPELTPDQRALGFTAPDGSGKTQVFVQPVSGFGGSAKQVTNSAFGVEKFAFAADGESVFYQETRHPERPNKLTASRYTTIEYRFNGKGYFPEDETFYLLRQKLAGGDPDVVYKGTARFTFDAVDPKGRYVVLTAPLYPDEPTNAATDTFLVASDGQQTHVQTGFARGEFHAQAFSPDGKRLLLAGEANTEPTDMRSNLYTYDLAAGSFQTAQQDQDVEVGALVVADMQQNLSGQIAAYAGDGTYYALVASHGAVSLNRGQDLERVFGDKYHVTDFVLQADGQGAYVTVSTATQASRLLKVDFASGQATELYNPNADYEAEHTIVAPQEFTFERAGLSLQGWYFAPAQKATTHPAVLYVHGGPHAAYGYSFFHELQVQAGLGYGVITLNPRGSSSYGNDFKQRVVAHYGSDDYEDLMAAVDYAQQLDPTIDSARLYCAGGSYGGFMSNWVETHTDRFAAVATCRSISNWTSFMGTSDIGFSFGPREMAHEFVGGVADQETLWQASPLAYVDQAKSPILILHGEEDYRCPIEQGEQFFTALRLHGVEAEFMRFPKSNHELSRSGIPSLRIERMQAITDWFAAH